MELSELKTRTVHFRLTEAEYSRLQHNMESFGAKCLSDYVKRKVFDKPIQVINYSPDTHKYYVLLTKLFSQFRALGNNYNQVVKLFHAAKTTDGMYRLMTKIRALTVELMTIGEQILKLTTDYQEQWLQK